MFFAVLGSIGKNPMEIGFNFGFDSWIKIRIGFVIGPNFGTKIETITNIETKIGIINIIFEIINFWKKVCNQGLIGNNDFFDNIMM